MKSIIFGLGCFWWVQKYFDLTHGVISTQVWYAGGKQDHATYEDIWDHTEVVRIEYDETMILFTEMIQKFIEKKDPTFPEYKTQYDGLILYNNEDEKNIVNELFYQLEQSSEKKVTVRVEKNGLYFPAEERHQKYLFKQESY